MSAFCHVHAYIWLFNHALAFGQLLQRDVAHTMLQVRSSILQVLDISAYSIVASEADYLAAQWAELPQLQRLKTVGSPNCS